MCHQNYFKLSGTFYAGVILILYRANIRFYVPPGGNLNFSLITVYTEQCDTYWGQGWWVCCPASPRRPPPVSEFPQERVWSTPPQQAGPPHTGNPHWCSLLWYLKHAKIRSLNNSLHFSGFDTGEMQIFATACKMEFLNSYIPFTINYWSVCKLK